MIAAVLLATVTASPSPSPSPSASPLPVITTVRVATGSPQTLHKLPVAASVMDSAQLANTPATTGDAVLRNLPGFDRTRSNSNFTNYGQLRISFTGAGTDRGLVLADGVPAQDAFGGQIDWAEYPANDIVRAELLRGAGSALYGAGAIGGVLQLDTFGPARTPSDAQAAFTFGAGTNNSLLNYANVQIPISHTVEASVSAEQSQLSYFALAPGYTSSIDQPSQSQTSMASFRVRYSPTQSDSFEYGYRGAWDYQFEGRPHYDFWRRLHQNSFRFSHTTATQNLGIDAYTRDALVTNRADVFPQSPGVLRYTQSVPTAESGVAIHWTASSTHSEFAVRADERAVNGVSTQAGRNNVFQNSGSGAQQLAGVALQETYTFNRGEVVAGVRADEVSLLRGTLVNASGTTTVAPNTNRAVSPRMAVRYDLTPQLAIRVSDGAGFRPPFLNELVRGYQIGPIAYRPNPFLVPERSSSLSAGLDWSTSRMHVALDGFHTFVNDAIAFRTIDPTTLIRSNFSHTQTDGETLTITRALSPATRMQVYGTAQYARVTSGGPTDGKYLSYVPNGSAGIDVDTTVSKIGAGISISYLGQTYADDLNTQPLGTSVLLGAHVSVPIREGVKATVDVENATNARYLSSIDRYGPPATVTVAITVPVSPLVP